MPLLSDARSSAIRTESRQRSAPNGRRMSPLRRTGDALDTVINQLSDSDALWVLNEISKENRSDTAKTGGVSSSWPNRAMMICTASEMRSCGRTEHPPRSRVTVSTRRPKSSAALSRCTLRVQCGWRVGMVEVVDASDFSGVWPRNLELGRSVCGDVDGVARTAHFRSCAKTGSSLGF